jgi:phage terminase large subunit
LRQPATYYHVKNSEAKIQVHQGGTRSGKTYSILTALIELCHRNENSGAVITIARKTFPAIRASCMRDFFEILEREDIYNVELHNKSEATYILFGNLVEFISVDQPQKVRGRKRDILFVNEANELTLEDWRQLMLRTTGRAIIDYNPSDEFHWIYDHVLTRDDHEFFRTTYKDNPFLPEATVAEIERLKEADPDYWRVYRLLEGLWSWRARCEQSDYPDPLEGRATSPGRVEADELGFGLWIYQRPDRDCKGVHRRPRLLPR